MGHASNEPSREPVQPAPHQPFIPADQSPPEFTLKAVLFGAIFGILFGASTVYLALKAGLTVSASIPIAVLSISVLRYFGRPTILENNIVQTIGSAGESVAAGVAFTIPALLFLSPASGGEDYFNYVTIMTLAAVGGILGVLFMVPLRRSLIVGEHGTLPYPEGTACAEVLIAGEKGGSMAKLVFQGVGLGVAYNALMKVFALWKEAPAFITSKTATLPSASVALEPTAEYLGVGYILGPKVGGIMVSGGILSWMVLIPMLALIVPEATVFADLKTLGRSDAWIAQMSETNAPRLYYEAYVRYIGAGAVTMAGIITLIKTAPTIWRAIRESVSAMTAGNKGGAAVKRTERDMPIWVVGAGSIGLVALLAVLPDVLPGDFTSKLVMAVLIMVFGFLFVTVSSRIVGIIGSSSNPISGMTIATLLGTALVFLSMGMTGDVNQPIALSVGAIVCIAAANAGATSQDLKTGYLVGATPIRQQLGLIIGVIVSVLAIGWTLMILDSGMAPDGADHGIGTDKLPAPQATLMATVIKGVLSQNLPWGYILVGAALSVAVFLCGVSPLAWAVGAYLPIATTFTIFLGGLLRGLVDRMRGAKTGSEISPGMLMATGLVAGGSLLGVVVGALSGVDYKDVDGNGSPDSVITYLNHLAGEGLQARIREAMGSHGPDIVSVLMFGVLAAILFRVAMRKDDGAKV